MRGASGRKATPRPSNCQSMQQPHVIENLVSFDEDHTDSAAGPQLIIKNEQVLPDEYISTLKREKIDTLHTPSGEFVRVATIPTSVVEAWQREGFDINNEPIRDILARLRKLDMDAFITTNKRI